MVLRFSDICVCYEPRHYDKALEQGVDGHWVWVELAMHPTNANAFAAEMTNSNNAGKLAAQVINPLDGILQNCKIPFPNCKPKPWHPASRPAIIAA